jgi:peptide subunit release factor 1 (eRF1)
MPSKQPSKPGSAAMKIPRRDVVKFVIKEALQKEKAVSQKELAEIITKQLVKGESKYRITGRRARLLALEIPVKIMVETRKGRVPRKCPVCGRGLKRTHSKNLYGKKILTGLRCGRCGYHGTGGRWMPRKYSFSLS